MSSTSTPSKNSVSSPELVPPAAGSTLSPPAIPLPSIVAGPMTSTWTVIAGRSPVSSILGRSSANVIASRSGSEFDARIASRSVQWLSQVPSEVSLALLTTSPASSLLVIVTVWVEGLPSALPDGLESPTVNVCGFSATVSLISGTANVFSVSPAAKLSVPLVAV